MRNFPYMDSNLFKQNIAALLMSNKAGLRDPSQLCFTDLVPLFNFKL